MCREAIVVEYDDGRREPIPFVWVSEPINAGFWRKKIRLRDQAAGRRPALVALLDGEGKELARDRISDLGVRAALPNPDGSPGEADVDRKRKVATIRAGQDGTVALWTAPGRGDRRCFWWNRGSGCSEPRPDNRQVGFGIYGGSATVFLAGPVAEGVSAVELRYEDGGRETIRPYEGYVLNALPASRYAPG